MSFRDVIILSVCIALSVFLLITAGMQLDFINSQRQQMKLISNEPLENAPPSLAFATVAMGAFRGLVVDILWLRADRHKEKGEFFDARQLAEWITVLQPRFASVWEFHAWNMAYNISVAIPDTQPEQRWHWVRTGYELLRDRGIPLNPKSILLYRELSRIFQHKIGSYSDNVHKYYKLQLATSMEPLLGPANNEYFKSLAEAPLEWRQLIQDANVVGLVTALRSADERFADDKKFVDNYLSLRQNPKRFKPAAFDVIDDFRGSRALEKLDIFARAYHLRDRWKLEPVLMRRLNEDYGPVDWDDPNTHHPLDWRHPDSHAIYWAVRGLQVAGKEITPDEYSIDEANTDRIVNHSLQNLFRNGRLFIYRPLSRTQDAEGSDVDQEEVFLRPDLRMFKSYDRCVRTVLEKYKDVRDNTYDSLQVGHRNMLRNAVLSFYQAGHRRQAREIYNQLRELYPGDEHKEPLIIYVQKRFVKELERLGFTDARENVQTMLRESYFRYAIRNDDEAFGREKMAKEIYDHYQSKYRDENRIDLPDFKLLRYFALLDFFYDRQYPLELRRSLLARIKIERPKLAEQLERQEEELTRQLEQSK